MTPLFSEHKQQPRFNDDELNVLEAKIKGGDELRVYHFNDTNQDLDIQDEVLALIADLRREREKVKVARAALVGIDITMGKPHSWLHVTIARTLDEIREDG